MSCSEGAPSKVPPTRGDPVAYVSEQRTERLIGRLPASFRSGVRWLRRPGARWARIPAGLLLILGGLLGMLPVLGLWMLPLGLLLLAEDIAPLRRQRDRILDWVERRRPHWLDGNRNRNP